MNTRMIVDYQLLLTIFLAVLLWFFCSRLVTQRVFRWWAWAWTAFAGYLAIGDLVLRMPPVWTLLKTSLIMGAMGCGYLQPTFLAFGAYAFHGHQTARKTWVRIGVAVTLAASVLAVVTAFYLKQDPLRSFAARSAPRTLALSASLLFCAWVFIGEWRRRRNLAGMVTGVSCLLYGLNQGLYSLTCLRQLGVGPSTGFPLPSLQLFFSPLLLFVDFVYEFGICLGTVLLLLETHQRTERALLQSEIRADLFAESNAALQAEIAERKQAERELDRVFDYSVDMLCVVGFDGYFKRVSPSFERVLGWSEAELLASPLFDFVHPEDRERSRLAAKAHEVGQDAINFVNRYRCKDGSYKWFSWSAHPLVEEQIIIGVAHDITEIRRAQETETWLASFPTLNPNPIAEVDMTGAVLYMNPAAEQLFPDLKSRGSSHPWLAGLEEMAQVCRASANNECLREIFVGEACYQQSAYFVPSIQSLRLYGFNISKRKRSEAALRESERRLNEAQHNAHIGSWRFVPPDTFLWSDEMYELFKLPREVPVTYTSAHAVLHPEDRSGSYRGAFKKALESGENDFSSEYRVIWPDGQIRWMSSLGYIRRDGEGRAFEAFGTVQDITERKQAEEALRRSEQHLQEYERAIQGLDEMIAVVDREYRYVIANRAFLTYRGMTGKELLGRTISDVLGQDPFEQVVKAKLDESLRGEVVKYEMKYTYRELGERDLFISYFPIEGPAGVDRVACVLRDVTELKRAEQDMREVTGRLLQLQDEERRHIARELHDTTAQGLAGLCVNLSLLTRSAARWSDEERKTLTICRNIADQSLNELRTMSYLLHPPLLDELGLEPALRWFVEGFSKRSGILVSLDMTDLPRLPRDVELSLFRIVQESLSNVYRHSGSKVATVRLRLENSVLLEVEDDGFGLRPNWEASRGAASHLGVGIAGMRERVRQLGGDLHIGPRKPRGTIVRALVPVETMVYEAAGSPG